jgi:hypothetical protein
MPEKGVPPSASARIVGRKISAMARSSSAGVKIEAGL